jgi:hypothetical protein
MALAYQKDLKIIDPKVLFLMTLYLSPSLTPDEIRRAKKAGVVGVKSYPRGVTTNSEGGIESYEVYYPIFEAMQEVDMVLNLHGEVPSDADKVCSSQSSSPLHLLICLEHPHSKCGAYVPSSPIRYTRKVPQTAHCPRACNNASCGGSSQEMRTNGRMHNHCTSSRSHRRRLGWPITQFL